MKQLMKIEGVKPKTVREISKQIMKILDSPAGDYVKKSALKVLAKSIKVTVQGCSFTGDTSPKG
jgi:hypothetical protein